MRDTVWHRSSEDPVLDGNTVHVWRASLAVPRPEQDRLEAILSPDERERAARFRYPSLRAEFVACRGVQRLILSRYSGVPPGELRFHYSSYGKPSLDPQIRATDIRFNVANSGGLALYAVCHGRAVGIDIEKVHAVPDAMDVAERFFSAREVQQLRALPPALRDRAFLSCWTRKEAYVKAAGEGLSLPLDSFDVELRPGDEAARLVATRPDPRQAGLWSMRDLDCGAGHLAAVVWRGPDLALKCLDWQYQRR